MIVKVYRYKLASGKWHDFLEIQRKADMLYRKNISYEIQFLRSLDDPQKITEIHTYPTKEMADLAGGLHKIEPEVEELFRRFLALLDLQDAHISEEVGEIVHWR